MADPKPLSKVTLPLLPVELINHICQHLDHDLPRGFIWDPGYGTKRAVSNVSSLRLTCRTLYKKISYISANRCLDKGGDHSKIMRLYFRLDFKALAMFLHIRKLSEYRRRVREIIFRGRVESTNFQAPEALLETWATNQRSTDLVEFLRSSEVGYLLAEGLSYWKDSNPLEKIRVELSWWYHVEGKSVIKFRRQERVRLWEVFLRALYHTEFPRALLEINLHSKIDHQSEYQLLNRSIPDMGHLIRSVNVHECFIEWSGESRHLQGYCPNNHFLRRRFGDMPNIEELDIGSCVRGDRKPVLCDGCDALFVNHFDPKQFQRINDFRPAYIKIRGVVLSKFVIGLPATLRQIYLWDVYLTEGCWRTVFQDLRNAELSELYIQGDIFQRDSCTGSTTLPFSYDLFKSNSPRTFIKSSTKVRAALDELIKDFRL